VPVLAPINLATENTEGTEKNGLTGGHRKAAAFVGSTLRAGWRLQG